MRTLNGERRGTKRKAPAAQKVLNNLVNTAISDRAYTNIHVNSEGKKTQLAFFMWGRMWLQLEPKINPYSSYFVYVATFYPSNTNVIAYCVIVMLEAQIKFQFYNRNFPANALSKSLKPYATPPELTAQLTTGEETYAVYLKKDAANLKLLLSELMQFCLCCCGIERMDKQVTNDVASLLYVFLNHERLDLTQIKAEYLCKANGPANNQIFYTMLR